VQKRLKQYREEEGRMLGIIRSSSHFLDQDNQKEVVIIDLTPYQRRPYLIKNLAFLLYPEALAVLEVYSLLDRGVKSNDLGLSMSLSINGNKATRNISVDHADLEHRRWSSGCGGRYDSLRIKTGDAEEGVSKWIFNLWSYQQN
jgi:hypothetical protein